MKMNEYFRKALIGMVNEGEFEKIAACCKNPFERKKIRRLAKALREAVEKGSIDNISLCILVQAINSADVWKDIFYYMVSEEAKEEQ